MDVHVPHHLPVRSRAGNGILATLGLIVALAAAALLIYSLVTTWGYGGRIDHAIQFLLVAEVLIGGIVTFAAMRNMTEPR